MSWPTSVTASIDDVGDWARSRGSGGNGGRVPDARRRGAPGVVGEVPRLAAERLPDTVRGGALRPSTTSLNR
jgi:hypothetical protein